MDLRGQDEDEHPETLKGPPFAELGLCSYVIFHKRLSSDARISSEPESADGSLCASSSIRGCGCSSSRKCQMKAEKKRLFRAGELKVIALFPGFSGLR